MAETTSRFQDLYPAGIFRLKVIGQKLGVSSKGSMYLKLKVEVLSLKKADKPSSQPIIFGGHRFVDLYLTEKTIEKTKAFVLAAGFKGKSIKQLDPDHSDFQSLIGFEFDATNKPEKSQSSNEKYAGKIQDRFSALPVGGSSDKWMASVKGVDAVVAAQFDALWNSAPSPAGYQKPSNAQTKASQPATKTAVADEGPAPDWTGGIPEDSSW